MDFYNFYTGREQNAWKWMGAHTDGQETVFRTFAPAAAGVSVVTDTGDLMNIAFIRQTARSGTTAILMALAWSFALPTDPLYGICLPFLFRTIPGCRRAPAGKASL